jgi:metal-responsive CopG/Arc/MetJ family transcriptional regulator
VKAKIAITLDTETVRRLDFLVERQKYESRSRAVQEAIDEKLQRLDRRRLAEECGKLDSNLEQNMAEEGFAVEAGEWPEY